MTSVREAAIDDISAMFDIRVSVRENAMTREQLDDSGIDVSVVAGAITESGRGWIAEENGQAIGFSIASREDGSIFAVFVRPEFEGKGHGGRLLDAAVGWLCSRGFERLWLATGPNTRAHRFYLKRGWVETGEAEENGDIHMELTCC